MSASEESIRILMVEDNPADVYLMQQALAESGIRYELQVCPDGEKALAMLNEPGALPDLVLLDINLPRIGGADIVHAIRGNARLENLPVVLLSSSQSPEDKARAADIRRGTYMVKPADLDEYLALGTRIYNFWREATGNA